MVPLKHFIYHRCVVLFLLLLPPALSVPYYDLDDHDGGILKSPVRASWEETDIMPAKKSSGSFIPRPALHSARPWSGDPRKRYLPYHPVVRFRSPKHNLECPEVTYTRRFEERFKKDLSAGEILALLSTIMVDRASKGRLKGLRFGISKR